MFSIKSKNVKERDDNSSSKVLSEVQRPISSASTTKDKEFKSNVMKGKKRFMNNPFDKVSMLSSGIRMLDEKGAIIPKESKPFNRDTSNMTLNEYAKMKNSEGGRISQISQSNLNNSN